jgi:DNA-binding HxlR family transcriptional regulator
VDSPHRKTHSQYCSVARALDVVGDRWTLLIVRELSLGPRRFTDLVDGVPGISRNLLAQRLRELEHDAVVERRALPPPAARQVYALTDDGRELAAAMLPLAAWGVRRLGKRRRGEAYRPHWAALAMAAFADRSATVGVRETYQFLVDDEAFHFRVDDGQLELHQGLAENAAATVRTDGATWADLASGALESSAALRGGQLEASGEPEALGRLNRIFSREAMLDENGKPRR